MRIHTQVQIDLETGRIEHEAGYEYYGPLACCDRALTQMATQAGKTATQVGADYGATAGQIQSGLIPRLTQQAVEPPGYGPMGLAQMETVQEAQAAAETGAEAEQARLKGMRTGNVASIGAEQVAGAEGASRSMGGALQRILAQNAMLKTQQQEQANRMLTGLAGQDIQAQEAAMRLVPENIRTAIDAQKVGWLQNVLGVMGAVGQLGAGMGGLVPGMPTGGGGGG